ncbi:MAG: nitroreductase [Actinomycetota bacterium]|nr:nitroreductase [Actinomycetota bacterium]
MTSEHGDVPVTTVLTVAVAEHLALMATRAPSVHNSQPWSLVVRGDGIDVRADWSRRMQVIDPMGRQLFASCGALVHHLAVSARALGLDSEVALLPDNRDHELVAHVRLSPSAGQPSPEDLARAEAVLHRSTNRRRFFEAPVTPAVLDTLRQAVQAQGVILAEVRDEDRVAVDVMVEHAERELQADEGYREELRSWVFDPLRDGERGDGIPVAAVDGGPGRAEELAGRAFVPTAEAEHQPNPAEHPTAVLVTTTGDQPIDWVRSGMGLSALLLEAAQAGLVAQPIGQVTDVAYERARLRRDLGLVGVPQLLLRLGTAREKLGLQTPRRTVESVLTWAEAPALTPA